MRGEDHAQGAGGVALHGDGVLRAVPVSHQSHEQLVGPGDSKGRRQPLLPGPEAGNRLVTQNCGHATPNPLPRGLLTLVAQAPRPAPPQPLSPGRARPGSAVGAAAHSPSVFPGISMGGGEGAYLVDAQHRALVGGTQLAQCSPQRL